MEGENLIEKPGTLDYEFCMFFDDLQAIHFHASLMRIERPSILKPLESKKSFNLTELRILRVNPYKLQN